MTDARSRLNVTFFFFLSPRQPLPVHVVNPSFTSTTIVLSLNPRDLMTIVRGVPGTMSRLSGPSRTFLPDSYASNATPFFAISNTGIDDGATGPASAGVTAASLASTTTAASPVDVTAASGGFA